MSSKIEEYDPGFLDYLANFITPHKKAAMEKVLAKRTRFITVVLEDIYKPHNASAVLRTCDCFGVQDVHVIEKTNKYKVNPYVTRGASDWVDLHKYYDPEGSAVENCFSSLRKNNYMIYGTSPDPEAVSLDSIGSLEKIALVFGNEHEGISSEVKKNVDGLVHIPMMGFTESFNISVAASIFLYELVNRASKKNHPDFYISEEEKQILRMKWYKSVVKRSDLHEKAYLASLIRS